MYSISNETLWSVRVTIVAPKAAMLSLSTVVDLHVSVNNTKSLSVAMEMQEGIPFALLLSYEVCLSAVNSTGTHALRSSCKVPDTLDRF